MHTYPKAQPAPDPSLAPTPCEECGNVQPLQDCIAFAMCVGVLGHPTLAGGILCQQQHWACSLPCWDKIAAGCVASSHDTLLQAHATLPDSIHHDHAVAALAEKGS